MHSFPAIFARLEAANFRVKSLSIAWSREQRRQHIRCQLRWPTADPARIPSILGELERTPGLIQMAWRAASAGPT